jgi:hypothetical protein
VTGSPRSTAASWVSADFSGRTTPWPTVGHAAVAVRGEATGSVPVLVAPAGAGQSGRDTSGQRASHPQDGTGLRSDGNSSDEKSGIDALGSCHWWAMVNGDIRA